ncbi:MAG: CoA-disulfide reductase, partial [Lentisphaeria bacterium]|nr:CoA-disulfide reductase [Lentisphaeria bacterium]
MIDSLTEQAPVLIVLCPFLMAFVVFLAGMKYPKTALPLTIVGVLGCIFASILCGQRILENGFIEYRLGGWKSQGGLEIGIHYYLDNLTLIVLIAICITVLATAVYSWKSVQKDLVHTPKKIPIFYTLYLLLCTGLFGMTVTGDAFNLYVLLEITSLSSYALIAIRKGRAVLSCYNYLIMGTIGASFYLLGVGYLYMATGSLNIQNIHSIIQAESLYGSSTILTAFVMILVGLFIKMAFFPLHGWLPNAYSFASTTSGAIMAPLMTKVTIYIMIRVMLSIFGADYIFEHLPFNSVIIHLATLAIFAGAWMALAQKNLRKMLCYIIVAEVGYMVGGAWLANEAGMIGAIYHILSDALMTLAL